MKTLTIIASNRDRFDLNTKPTEWFLKSLNKQTSHDFELILADGGSKNIEELKKLEKNNNYNFPIRIVSHKLGELFERAKLNNVGIRHARTMYAMTTDVDIFFAPEFVDLLISKLNPGSFIQSRTLYWKPPMANKIYKGEIDPFTNIDQCKIGRIKKRTTAGGCQCTYIENWFKVKGFDEAMVQWGSEDYDLYLRMKKVCKKTIWMGEDRDSIMVFHQPHSKSKKQLDLDLKYQNDNKKLLRATRINPNRTVNENEWGGAL